MPEKVSEKPRDAVLQKYVVIPVDMDTLGIESRAFRMRGGCDTTTPCAPCNKVELLTASVWQRTHDP